MDSEKEREMLKERDAQRLSRKRKATITKEQPSKKPKLRSETIDELRNYLRVVDSLKRIVIELMCLRLRMKSRLRIVRPKIEDRDNFELKGQFLKELRTNTFSGSDHEDANEHIKKVLEIVDLFHIPNITIDQVMLRAFPIGAIPLKTAADAKIAIQEMDEYSKKWRNGTSRSRSTETSDGLVAIQAQHNNLGREIKKVNEKVYVDQVRCEQCKGPHYTKDCPLKKEGKTLGEAYYTQFGGPFQGGGYRVAAPRFYQRNNTNPSYQERRQSMEDILSKCISESGKRPEENSNLIKEIQASMDAAIQKQRASIKTLEIQIRQMSKVLQERGFGSLPSSTKLNPRDQVKLISTTIEVDSYLIRHIGSNQYAVSTGQNRTLIYETRQTTIPFLSRLNGASVSVMPLLTYLNLGLGELAHTKLTVELADMTVKYRKGIAENVLVGIGKFVFPVDFIILDMPEDIKVPLILERSFLSIAVAKIDVYKRKITLRVGEERIIFTSVKPASSLIKRVYMLSLRERMELDLEARLMGETLVINRSLDPLNGDYIELNDLNEPFELRRNQGDDLMPTIEEGEVIEEFKTRDDELDTGIDDYPSYCDYDKKIHIDYAHNLKFSCMIGFEFTHANFFPLLYVNVMSKEFHNSIMKDKMVYKGNNVVGALMNVPIFVGTFSVVTDFAVLEDMDAYRDEGMGDVIFGEPFLREVGIKARRFKGMITIYNGNDKVSDEDKKNGISHPYKKLMGFYKGVLNLEPDYIRDVRTEEWLTRGHINVHEIE
ncbi:DNA-directed DNA polymerase [Tanacetum coccineum]